MEYDLTSSHNILCNMIQNSIEIGTEDLLRTNFQRNYRNINSQENEKYWLNYQA